MTPITALPHRLRDAATREFAGEPVRWSAQPSPRAVFLRTLPIWLFAIPWTAFSLFWETMAIGGFIGLGSRTGSGWSWFVAAFVLFGLPFIAVGIGMMAAPFWRARQAARSLWVVTTRRITYLKADGSGSLKLTFGDGRDSDGDKVERSEAIQDIPDVRKVEDLIRRMIEPQA